MTSLILKSIILSAIVINVPFVGFGGCRGIIRELADDLDNIADDLEDDDDNHSFLDWFDGDD